jgi:hypothetical protein
VAKRSSSNTDGTGGYGNRREALVGVRNDSNARPGSSTRKSLPINKFGSKDMDQSSWMGKVETIAPAIKSYYLDSDDDRGRK